LLAAANLSDVFHIADLVVAAWDCFPGRFALKGHWQYPDSKRVESELAKVLGRMFDSGRRSPAWLYRVRPCFYAITDLGRRELVLIRRASR
jgi:hypothetical protein